MIDTCTFGDLSLCYVLRRFTYIPIHREGKHMHTKHTIVLTLVGTFFSLLYRKRKIGPYNTINMYLIKNVLCTVINSSYK
jgi:hypothetical protein